MAYTYRCAHGRVEKKTYRGKKAVNNGVMMIMEPYTYINNNKCERAHRYRERY
jgi:hypothetical protein